YVKGQTRHTAAFRRHCLHRISEKTAYFIENCDRHSTPLLFVQDVSGFMVGAEAEHSGIIRAGARFVEAMACAKVPKIVLTVQHAAARGLVDAIVTPENLRDSLLLALQTCLNTSTPHIGAFVLQERT